jgi:hypothetical protein
MTVDSDTFLRPESAPVLIRLVAEKSARTGGSPLCG